MNTHPRGWIAAVSTGVCACAFAGEKNRVATGAALWLAWAAVLAGLGGCGRSPRVGDPCVPEDEYEPHFAGFSADDEVIHDQVFDCVSRVCVVDGFQGRSTCPLGQPPPQACAGQGDASCPGDAQCQEAGDFAPACGKGGVCEQGLSCNEKTWRCECEGVCPGGYSCDAPSRTCKRFVCHVPGSCQDASLSDAENEGKECCIPGTDRPVGEAVCGRCDDAPSEEAVYCSCRCDGPNACDCPDDFECREGVPPPAGGGPRPKYCFRRKPPTECGSMVGYRGEECR